MIEEKIRGPYSVYGAIVYYNEDGPFFRKEFADRASYEDALNKACAWAASEPRRDLYFEGERLVAEIVA